MSYNLNVLTWNSNLDLFETLGRIFCKTQNPEVYDIIMLQEISEVETNMNKEYRVSYIQNNPKDHSPPPPYYYSSNTIKHNGESNSNTFGHERKMGNVSVTVIFNRFIDTSQNHPFLEFYEEHIDPKKEQTKKLVNVRDYYKSSFRVSVYKITICINGKCFEYWGFKDCWKPRSSCNQSIKNKCNDKNLVTLVSTNHIKSVDEVSIYVYPALEILLKGHNKLVQLGGGEIDFPYEISTLLSQDSKDKLCRYTKYRNSLGITIKGIHYVNIHNAHRSRARHHVIGLLNYLPSNSISSYFLAGDMNINMRYVKYLIQNKDKDNFYFNKSIIRELCNMYGGPVNCDAIQDTEERKYCEREKCNNIGISNYDYTPYDIAFIDYLSEKSKYQQPSETTHGNKILDWAIVPKDFPEYQTHVYEFHDIDKQYRCANIYQDFEIYNEYMKDHKAVFYHGTNNTLPQIYKSDMCHFRSEPCKEKISYPKWYKGVMTNIQVYISDKKLNTNDKKLILNFLEFVSLCENSDVVNVCSDPNSDQYINVRCGMETCWEMALRPFKGINAYKNVYDFIIENKNLIKTSYQCYINQSPCPLPYSEKEPEIPGNLKPRKEKECWKRTKFYKGFVFGDFDGCPPRYSKTPLQTQTRSSPKGKLNNRNRNVKNHIVDGRGIRKERAQGRRKTELSRMLRERRLREQNKEN